MTIQARNMTIQARNMTIKIRELFEKILEDGQDPVDAFEEAIEDIALSEKGVIEQTLRLMAPEQEFDVTLNITVKLDADGVGNDVLAKAISEKFHESPLSIEQWFNQYITDWQFL